MVKDCGSHLLSRRSFLRGTSRFAIASAIASNSLGVAGLMRASQSMASTEGYKALVFVFLNGGNDSFNTFAPLGSSALRNNYVTNRGVLGLSQSELIELNIQNSVRVFGELESSSFGIHPECGHLAEMFNNRELAVMCNIGNLVAPVTRDQYMGNTTQPVSLPPKLFSHSDQQRQFQSEPTSRYSYGWGGRLAELLTSYNTNPLISPLISLAGLNPFQVSLEGEINPYTLGNEGIVPLKRFEGARSQMVTNYMATIDENAHLMAQKYTNVFSSATVAQEIIESAFSTAESSGVNFDDIFTNAGVESDSVIGNRLKTVAKMIKGRSQESNKRPIYFVEMNGFDQHANMLPNHRNRMREMNAALKGFRDCLMEQNDYDKVLTYVGSEFARTLTPNGNDPSTSGSDHAWSGHAFAFGDMIDGGKFFGTHPDLALGSGLDVGRGRFIPTNSSSQCSAIAANWMGVAQSDLNIIFPSLQNFDSPFDDQTNLNFIKVS